jgi:hypothetical protein
MHCSHFWNVQDAVLLLIRQQMPALLAVVVLEESAATSLEVFQPIYKLQDEKVNVKSRSRI